MLTYNGGSKAHIINNNGQLIVGADNPSYSGSTYGGDNGGTDSVLTSDGTNGLKWVAPVALLGAGTDGQVLTYSNNNFNWDNQVLKNTSSIQKLQYASPLRVANSPAIYGTLPSSPPMMPTTAAINSGYEGWYFKNVSSVYNNISWGMSFQPSSYVVSNLKGFYFTFVSLTTTSKPFLSVYTLPPTSPNYYLSRRSYVPAGAPATIAAGIPYIYYYMFDSSYPTPFKYLHQELQLRAHQVARRIRL
jgi:hypothetical protein